MPADTTSLARLFAPRSVAVVGASRRAGSVGGAILHNLLRGGFQGPVYPVNAAAAFVQSVRAHPSLRALPEVPDLAVIAVPAEEVIAIVREAGKLHVPAVCVISAGFGEVAAGRGLERELANAVREAGLRLLGPNCLGLQNADPRVRLDATFATTFAPEGRIGFASQSGALGLAALDYAQELGIGFSLFASLGNKTDVSGNDILEYLGHDERTRVILLYLESLGNPQHLRQIAERVGREKPIALVKSGRSGAGARAAGSHTGAITGPDAAVSALCKQTGMIRAETLEELFDVAMVLANQPLPRGDRVGVVTNAGGPGILAADALEAAGLHVPPLTAESQARLREALPAAGSVGNPIDILADSSAEVFGRALAIAHDDPQLDALLAIFVPPIITQAEAVAAAIVGVAARATKPILSCFMGTHGVPESLRSLHTGHVPSFRFPEGAAQALALVSAHARWRLKPAAALLQPTAVPDEALRALRLARERLGPPGGWLSAQEAALLCRAWGLTAPAERLVAPTVAAAEAAAAELGYPVALKVQRQGLVHKASEGGVALGLGGPRELREAVSRLLHLAPESLLLQRQVGGGEEWLVGAIRDPDYGPLITVGAGGTRTEIWHDVEQRLAPLTQRDLDALLDRPRFARTLAGNGGRKPGDRAALADFVRQLSFAALSHPEIEEMEANPLLVLPAGEGAVAVDVRARIGACGGESV
ncbi:MAG: acetate--CoA ligase family protein [Myxococcales bacterium]